MSRTRKATQERVVLKTLQSEYAFYTIQLQSITVHYMGRSAHRVITQLVKWRYPFPK